MAATVPWVPEVDSYIVGSMTSSAQAPMRQLSNRVVALAQALERPDLASRVGAAAIRASRPATVVCVVGEFKQGKSSLINALLAEEVCPVDDDLATSALTVVRHGPANAITVRRGSGEDSVVEQVDFATLEEWVSERGNPDNERDVERVDVMIPHPLLAGGLVIVDTPGMGGLGAGHAAATMAFLPFADGLVLVSDVSAELSGPELEFLDKARELCPVVVLAQPKIDLYPDWRKIVDINQGHLTRFGLSIQSIPLSSELRRHAVRDGDGTLDQRSGYPRLLEVLTEHVILPAKRIASERATIEIRDTIAQLESPMEEELALLDDPARAAEMMRDLERSKERLDELRGQGARWTLHLGDSTTDLSNEVAHGLRGSIRELQREMDEAIELLKTPEDWDALAGRLQTATGDAITRAFAQIEEGGRQIREDLVEILATDSLDLQPIGSTNDRLDVSELWRAKAIGRDQSKAGAALGSTLTGLRGAQSGMIMLGMVGQFLPKGATLLLLSNPVTLTLGAAFAGMQLLDAHKRKIQSRRQQARGQVRQFLDDVQFEAGHRINEALRELQRALRDDFTERIEELQRTYAQAAQQAQQAAQASKEHATQRKAQIATRLEELAAVRAQLQHLVPAS